MLGKNIFVNIASFLRIPQDELEANLGRDREEQREVLDDTRIHPAEYEIARKMAADALEIDEEDLEGGEIKSQAIIEFGLDGTVLQANENFLSLMGYRLGEIVGKHHSIFVEPAYAQTQEYAEFWRRLGRGEFDSAEYKRLGKDGDISEDDETKLAADVQKATDQAIAEVEAALQAKEKDILTV